MELAMSSTQAEHSPTGAKAAAISNLIVRTMSEYTGRGPTRARTHISHDVVTVLLQDTLTKGERSLVQDNLDELVLSGRKVIAFFSDNHIDPDMAVEVFVLAPADDGAGRE